MSRREKRPLGDLFGLKNFGVNLTTLHPGGASARHPSSSRTIHGVMPPATHIALLREGRLEVLEEPANFLRAPGEEAQAFRACLG